MIKCCGFRSIQELDPSLACVALYGGGGGASINGQVTIIQFPSSQESLNKKSVLGVWVSFQVAFIIYSRGAWCKSESALFIERPLDVWALQFWPLPLKDLTCNFAAPLNFPALNICPPPN